MRGLKNAVAIVLLVAVGLPDARCALFGLFPDFWGNVIVATDTTDEGKKLTPPSPGNPVYYLGRSLGERLGTIPGDELPDEKVMTGIVTLILEKQGYLAARPGVNEPTLFMVVQWGYLRPGSGDMSWFLGYNPADDIAANGALHLSAFRTRETETILHYMSGPIYGIIVTAFEFESARTSEPVIYWQTRIGLPANGKSMEEALPVMFDAAGPAIGRPSDKPVLRTAGPNPGGRVWFGEIKVLDVLETLPDEVTEPKR
jgi:hypothetical protein